MSKRLIVISRYTACYCFIFPYKMPSNCKTFRVVQSGSRRLGIAFIACHMRLIRWLPKRDNGTSTGIHGRLVHDLSNISCGNSFLRNWWCVSGELKQ